MGTEYWVLTQKMLHLILFLFFGAICVAGAINLLVQSHPINSALSVIAVMAALAAEYLLLGAEFVAAVQVIVYAGAIMVLFLITIMLLNAGAEERTRGSRVAILIGIPGVLIGGVLVAWTLLNRSNTQAVPIGALKGDHKDIASLLFQDFVLPFAVSVAMIIMRLMRRGGVPDQSQHHRDLHVDRADAQWREPFVRGLRSVLACAQRTSLCLFR